MKLSRLAAVDHPLAIQLQRAFGSLTAGLQWDSAPSGMSWHYQKSRRVTVSLAIFADNAFGA